MENDEVKKASILTFEVGINDANQRIDKFLGGQQGIDSRSRAEFLIDSSCVLVNNKSIKRSYQTKTGDIIQVILPDPASTDIQPADIPIDIVYEDDDVLVVNKQAGLVVHPAAGHQNDTLVNALIARSTFKMKFGEDRPGIVHRLDKETSGLLVVAKHDQAQENLVQQFKSRQIHRIYHAICYGKTPDKGEIMSYLARHPNDRKKYASVLDSQRKIARNPNEPPAIGKWSHTTFSTQTRLGTDLSYVILKLHTGRTHQIRVHMSEAGHPLVADNTYLANRKWQQIKSKSLRENLMQIDRVALHAAELGFTHPVTGESKIFKLAWPNEMLQKIQSIFGKSID